MDAEWPRPERLVTRITPLGDERWELRLDGPLAPGWAGSLAAGLAQAGIRIDRGHARGTGAGSWSARIEVVRTPSAVDPRSLDVAALAAADSGAGFATPIALDHFALHASLDHGGTLHLQIGAADALPHALQTLVRPRRA